jgi:hypothetical protein
LELENQQGHFPALNFYCNWVLHSRLSRSEVGKRIVEVFDRAETFYTAMDDTPPGEQLKAADWTWIDEFSKEIQLRRFRAEFQDFCNAHDIRGALVSSEKMWLGFLNHYAGIIEDVPLISTDGRLEHIREVITRRIPIPLGMSASELGKAHIFALQWEWTGPSGIQRAIQRIFTYELTGWSMYTRFIQARMKYYWRVRLLRRGPF